MCGGINGSPWDIFHRRVGRDRHRIDMCGGTHGSPWDIVPTSYLGRLGQDRHIGLTCVVAHGLTCVVAHMGVPGISFIEQWDGINT